jgi:ABC-type Na+ efflux pump permease subunit
VRFERKHAWLLLGIALWLLLTWLMFAKNLGEAYADGEDRPDGYWIAHSVLIVVNLTIAAVLSRLGWKAHRATRSSVME